MTQVDSVTQQNAAHAEETASAAEELSSQAAELRRLLSAFRLEKPENGARQVAAAASSAVRSPDGWGVSAGSSQNGQEVVPASCIALNDAEFDRC